MKIPLSKKSWKYSFIFFVAFFLLFLTPKTANAQQGTCDFPTITDVNAAGLSSGIRLSWGGTGDSYTVSRDGAQIATISSGGTSYTDTEVACDGTNHTYVVRATKICGGSVSSEPIFAMCAPPTYTMSGTAFIDNNRNGSRDGGEPGYAGARVTLSGNRTGAVNTDSSGGYSFSGLPAGNYVVRITMPSGFESTYAASHGGNITGDTPNLDFALGRTYTITTFVFVDTNRDGSQNNGEGLYTSNVWVSLSILNQLTSNGRFDWGYNSPRDWNMGITVPSGYASTTSNPRTISLNSNTNVYFGITPLYSISGSVFIDTNRNGTRDAGETGYNGATVTLAGTGSGTTTTNGSGAYTFSNRFAGSYTARVTVPSGYASTGANPRSFTVTNANVANINLGIVPLYSISGSVFVDTNRNGVRDGGESGYNGASVTLAGTGTGTTTSNGTGSYTFANQFAGSYTVRVTVPSGYTNTTANPLSFTATNANVNNLNLGIVPWYTISGSVYVDTNRNNVRDSGESGFNGVTVTLAGTGSGTTTSNSTGAYTFINRFAGNYTLQISVPSGYINTGPNPRAITITNANLTNINLGIVPLYSLSGNVFIDGNRNGTRDSGEIGYVGATLTLGGAGTGTATSNGSGTYSFTNQYAGTYTVRITIPSGYTNTSPTTVSITITNANVTNVNFGIEPFYSISGNVFVDTNENGIRDGGESNSPNVAVALSGLSSASTTTNASGMYTFNNLVSGNYSVQITVPAGHIVLSPNPRAVVLGPNTSVNFAIVPVYSVTGSVFVDDNKNRRKESTESNYTGAITIQASGTVSTAGGTYTVSNLRMGTYTISYTSGIPSGFQLIYPLNGPPPSYSVTVGPTCTVDATTGASCSARGDIQNLHFSISDSFPWLQSVGASVRFDAGYNNYIASNPACSGPYGIVPGSSTTQGFVGTGSTAPRFGYGNASAQNWVLGGSAYPSLFTPTASDLVTSYRALSTSLQKGGISPVSIQTLSGCGSLSSCTLPNNLQSNSAQVFVANGNLTLAGYNFPNNKNYIFLINGTLRLTGNIDVPSGSVVIFSASQDIVVDRAIGQAPTCNPSNNIGIEGVFSADRNVIFEGTTDCSTSQDTMLKVEGTIIANAGLTSGAFQNQRDLCGNNKSYPAVSLVHRPDFILNVPDVLRQKSFTYQEVAP